MKVSDVITLLGGPAETAKLFGVELSAVSNWKKRGFPERLHFRLSRELALRGHTVDPTRIKPSPLRRGGRGGLRADAQPEAAPRRQAVA
jgi:hypothetical protein